MRTDGIAERSLMDRRSRATRLPGRPLGPADRSDFPAAAAAAEELLGAVGFESGDAYPRGHFDRLEGVAGRRVDAAQIADVAFPGRMPELVADPSDTRDEA